MARAINRLTARTVQTLSRPGRHADGGGLYPVVDEGGAKRWIFLYRLGGRRREMALGGVIAVPLARAREKAAEARGQIDGGRDSVATKQAAKIAAAPLPPSVTFADVAEVYMEDRAETWRNAAHRRQWRQTLSVQAAPLWAKPVATIATADVLAVLRPLWAEKPETARRLRGRIERVLDAAKAAEHRAGENGALARPPRRHPAEVQETLARAPRRDARRRGARVRGSPARARGGVGPCARVADPRPSRRAPTRGS